MPPTPVRTPPFVPPPAPVPPVAPPTTPVPPVVPPVVDPAVPVVDPAAPISPETAPVEEVQPPESGVKPMTPVLLWYAVGAIAYSLMFEKAYADVQNSKDGNGLFMYKEIAADSLVHVDSSTSRAAKTNGADSLEMGVAAIAGVIDSQAVEQEQRDGVKVSPEELNKRKESTISELDLDEENQNQP